MQNREREDRQRRLREHVERLIRNGKATRHGTGRIPDEFWDLPLPEDPKGLVLKSLLEDRRTGR